MAAPVAAKILLNLLSRISSEEKRRRTRKNITIAASILLLPILTIGYLFTSPIEAIRTMFTDENELWEAQAIQAAAPQYNPSGDYDASLQRVAGVSYFSQIDPRWKDVPYGTGKGVKSIGTTGCGPAAGSMVLLSLLGITKTPEEVAAWCVGEGYHIEDGTAAGFAAAFAAEHGLLSWTIPTDDTEALTAALDEGKLVIALMGAGAFTENSHYVVLCGLDDDGSVFVADPVSAERSRQTWDMPLICSEASSFTALYPAPEVSDREGDEDTGGDAGSAANTGGEGGGRYDSVTIM